MYSLAWVPGPTEWVVIGLISVLLFGRRLPEVGRNLGKSLVEFKRGIKIAGDELTDVREAVDDASDAASSAGSDEATEADADKAAKP